MGLSLLRRGPIASLCGSAGETVRAPWLLLRPRAGGDTLLSVVAAAKSARVAALVAVVAALLVSSTPAVSAQTLSSDAALSALAVSPGGIVGFDADDTSYEVGVASTVEVATVTASASHAAAEVAYSGSDADAVAAGYQVSLSAGRNAVTVTVTAEDGSTIKEYTLSINRGVATPYGWNAEHDLDGLHDTPQPRYLWTNGTTIWVLDASTSGPAIRAYNTDGTRDSSKDFNTLDAGNNAPAGIWSNGTTMWVADTSPHIYAYNMSTKARDPTKEFDDSDLIPANSAPVGIWSNGTTMWVADSGADKIFAYELDTKTYDRRL